MNSKSIKGQCQWVCNIIITTIIWWCMLFVIIEEWKTEFYLSPGDVKVDIFSGFVLHDEGLCLTSLKKMIPEWMIGQKITFNEYHICMILMFETSCSSLFLTSACFSFLRDPRGCWTHPSFCDPCSYFCGFWDLELTVRGRSPPLHPSNKLCEIVILFNENICLF